MNRIEALEDVKEKLQKDIEYLQETEKDHPMQTADPYWDTEAFTNLVNSLEKTLAWIADELEEEEKEADFLENEALPDDGIHTGALIGE